MLRIKGLQAGYGRATVLHDIHVDVAMGGLVQNDLGMARGDDLRAGFGRALGQHVVGLTLAKDFQMGVRFV